MGTQSKIEWTDHTFNPWRGCTKVAPGCANCYAETMSKRNPGTLGIWGPNGTRVVASEAMWREPVKWNREAGTLAHIGGGNRPRVFCASLADVFEDWPGQVQNSKGEPLYDIGDGRGWLRESDIHKGAFPGFDPSDKEYHVTLDDVRRRLFALIDNTPNLDWLLLTKRPENIRRLWVDTPCDYCQETTCGAHCSGIIDRKIRPNVWLGTSVATQEDADCNIPLLLECRDLSPVLFVSAEPLVGRVDFDECWPGGMPPPGKGSYVPGIDWIIVGGESGHGARPCNVEWIRSIRDQCAAAGVPCFIKQLGTNPVIDNPERAMLARDTGNALPVPDRFPVTDSKGGDWDEWPEDFRVRQFPEVRV